MFDLKPLNLSERIFRWHKPIIKYLQIGFFSTGCYLPVGLFSGLSNLGALYSNLGKVRDVFQIYTFSFHITFNVTTHPSQFLLQKKKIRPRLDSWSMIRIAQ